MKTISLAGIALSLSLAVLSPVLGQQMNLADQEMVKVRQAMSNQYAEAITRKDAGAGDVPVSVEFEK